jgi:hypothetical protein
MNNSTFVYATYIRTTPEKVFRASLARSRRSIGDPQRAALIEEVHSRERVSG